jgi:hypothetical protein
MRNVKCALVGVVVFILSTAQLVSIPVWNEYTGELGGWKESPWFGWFSSDSLEAGWAYHYEHGDIWIQGPGEDDLWFWDFEMGWLWTSRTYYPHIYGFADKAWLLYARQTLAPRWYYHFGRDVWIQSGSGFPAPTTTTVEIQSGTSASSMPSMVSLSDGSAIEMPPLGAQVPLTLGRENTDYTFTSAGIQVSGATRTLTVDPIAGMDPEAVVPRIIFPTTETGSLVKETINVLRVETIPDGQGGTMERKAFLPVTFHEDGTYSAHDTMMPETVHDAQVSAAQARTRAEPGVWENGQVLAPSSHKVRYITISFNGSLNYKRAPMLLRMLPTNSPPYRKPYSRASAAEQAEADKVVPHNIVVLVHGHNEEEKGGIYETSAPWPWLFAYKQDVWSLYFQLLDEYYFTASERADSYISPEKTTRFYEFIYPSYRGIFNDLDLELARFLETELAPQLDAGLPFNLVIIAHSMGGLVSRAAIQQFKEPLNDRFMELMTWGTPHLGSPLVSLRYAMGADLPYRFAFENDTASLLLSLITPETALTYEFSVWSLRHILRFAADYGQLDTPGTRDLRYVRRPRQESSYRLGLDNLFQLSAAQSTQENRQLYDLEDGRWIYNYNLQLMNQNDRHAGSDKYFPIVGNTERRVEFKKRDDYPWVIYDAVTGLDPDMILDNLRYETAMGATIMPLLVADPEEETIPLSRTSSIGTAAESDGAVNTPSMAAMGVAKWVGTAPGWDHEEYYGSPKYLLEGQGPTFTALSKGRGMAKFSLQRMVGGESDPSKSHDRYGLMRPPRFGYRFHPGSNMQSAGDEITINDVGNATVFDIIGNLRFHSLDDMYANPFEHIRKDRIRIVSDPERSTGAPVSIPVTNVEVAPNDLPNVSPGTSGSYIALDEYTAGNPRLFKGTVDISGVPVANKVLRTQFEFNDGSTIILSPSFTIHSLSIAGTWRLSVSVSNEVNEISHSITAALQNLPVDLDANGQGSFELQFTNEETEVWKPALHEYRTKGEWTISGTVSMANNRFELVMKVNSVEFHDASTNRWIDLPDDDLDETVEVEILIYRTCTAELDLTYIADYAPSTAVGEYWVFTPVVEDMVWEAHYLEQEVSTPFGTETIHDTNYSGTDGYSHAFLNR